MSSPSVEPTGNPKRIENVPTLLVYGDELSGRLRLIERLAADTGGSSLCAVLLTSPFLTGAPASLRADPGSNLVVRVTGSGCPCCVGRVSLRVAVTRLLREARPDRLIIELAREDHVRAAMAALAEDGLSPALRLAGVLEAHSRES